MLVVTKESSTMGRLIMREIDRELAKEMVIKNHYSHKWNTAFGKVNIGIFQEGNDKCLGVASFGNLMNPKSYNTFNKTFTQENVIELNRLWIDDCLGKNAETILLGASWKILRNDYPEIKAVQSFADGRLGCGTIYKASNFDYYGYTESLFYENILTGETQHKVPMENTKRPNGMIRLNTQWCRGELKPFYVKTYKYIYPLYKNTKIELQKRPYPSYDKGIIEASDYTHNPALIFRSMMLAYILGQESDYDVLLKYISSHYDSTVIYQHYEQAINNTSVKEVALNRGKIKEWEFLNTHTYGDLDDSWIE